MAAHAVRVPRDHPHAPPTLESAPQDRQRPDPRRLRDVIQQSPRLLRHVQDNRVPACSNAVQLTSADPAVRRRQSTPEPVLAHFKLFVAPHGTQQAQMWSETRHARSAYLPRRALPFHGELGGGAGRVRGTPRRCGLLHSAATRWCQDAVCLALPGCCLLH